MNHLEKKDKMNSLNSLEKVFQSANQGQIYRLVIHDTEKLLIEKALEQSRGNQLIAAKLLGLNRNTLRSKIKRLNIPVEKHRWRT